MADSNVQGNGAAGTSLEEIARQRDEARQQAESDAAQKLLQEMKEKETPTEASMRKNGVPTRNPKLSAVPSGNQRKRSGTMKSSLPGRKRSVYPMMSCRRTLSSGWAI